MDHSSFTRRALVAAALALAPVTSADGVVDDRRPPDGAAPVRDQAKPASESVRTVSDLIEDRVVIRLAGRASLAGSDIRVESVDQHIVLSGTVAEESDKSRAQRIARRTAGVRSVTNELEVDDDAKPRRLVPDAKLVPSVATAIADGFHRARAEKGELFGWEVESDRWGFAVEADGGEVELEGTVPTMHDVRRVVEAAGDVPGVRSVRADLMPIDDPRYNPAAGGVPYYYYFGPRVPFP